MTKSKKEKHYSVVIDNYAGTDTEAKLFWMTKKQIADCDFKGSEFAIIDGNVIKGFSEHFDSGRLK